MKEIIQLPTKDGAINPTDVFSDIDSISKSSLTMASEITSVNSSDEFDSASQVCKQLKAKKKEIEQKRKTVTSIMDGFKKEMMVPGKEVQAQVDRIQSMLDKYYIQVDSVNSEEISVDNIESKWEESVQSIYEFESQYFKSLSSTLVDSLKLAVKNGREIVPFTEVLTSTYTTFFATLIGGLEVYEVAVIGPRLEAGSMSEKRSITRMNDVAFQAINTVIGSIDEVRTMIARLGKISDEKSNSYYSLIKNNLGKYLGRLDYQTQLEEVLKEALSESDKDVTNHLVVNLVTSKAGSILSSSVKETYEPIVTSEGLMAAINWYLEHNEDGESKIVTALDFIFKDLKKSGTELKGVKFEVSKKVKI